MRAGSGREGNRRTMKGKLRLRERICAALELPADILPGGIYAEIRGRGSITVRGGGAILKYTDSEVRLSLSGGELVISGKSLCCRAFSIGAVTVTGRIGEVRFEDGEVER